MRAWKALGEKQRHEQADADLCDDVDADEDRRIEQHLAERRVSEGITIVLQTDEWPNQIDDVPECDVLDAHDQVVDDRQADEDEQVHHRRREEGVQQKGRLPLPVCAEHASPARCQCVSCEGCRQADQRGTFARMGCICAAASFSASAGGRAPVSACWIAVCIGREISGHWGCGPRGRAYAISLRYVA